MTNKEAIERLKVLTDYEYSEDLEALELAIKALERGDRYDEGYLDGMSGADWKGEEE